MLEYILFKFNKRGFKFPLFNFLGVVLIMKKFKILFYFIKEYLTVMLLMTGIRGIFLFVNLEKLEKLNFKLVSETFFQGIIFDTSITSYYLIGFIGCFILFRLFKSIYLERFGKIFLKIYKFIMSTLIFALMFVDIKYYKNYNAHLNLNILDHMNKLDDVILNIFSDKLSVILFIIFIFIEAVYLIISFKFFRILEVDEKELKKKYHFNLKVSFAKRFLDFVLEIVLYLAIGVFCIFGTRNDFIKNSLNSNKGYFYENYFSNDLSLNGVFSLIKDCKDII